MPNFVPGHRVWIRDEETAWIKATIIEVGAKDITVRADDRNETVKTLVFSEVEDIAESSNPDKDYLIEDLTKLPDLNQPSILETLDLRFQHDLIYTYTGRILIAVNPFKTIKGLYGPEEMEEFINLDLGDYFRPHAYGLSHKAFLNMLNGNGENQSILVSGESGAGKTVTTKLVMDYLTGVSQVRSGKSDKQSRDICNRVLNTNPLLEALGNAATLRNANSSRFGKLIHLQFRPGHSALIGAKIDTYLLEKARITSQQDGERNFHIFYELAAGLSSSELKEWFMPNLADCNYTSQSTRMERGDITDKEQFQVTLKAMQAIGLSTEERNKICKTVIAVLHLGNVEFEETFENKEEGSKISQKSQDSANKCCKLLAVNINILERALCHRSIVVGALANSSSVNKSMTADEARESRDALASAIYERLFLWIVWRVNQSISVVRDGAQKRLSGDLKRANQKFRRGKEKSAYHNDYSISCLDIFGFEVFERNGFEQMCINYANEVLQSIFNEFVFQIEQKYYETEGIDWTVVEFPDNQACIQMIETQPIGLLKLIDEECLYPKGNDDSLHVKLAGNLPKKYDTFTVDVATQRDHNLFSIKHFAGDVEYNVRGFHAKNKNQLRQEAVDLIRSSQDDLVKILLPPTAEAASGATTDTYFDEVANGKGKGNRRMRSSMERNRKRGGTNRLQQRTVSAHFKNQLSEAMTHIRASRPHFVRCIKPNDDNVSDYLDRPRTLEQLNYSGVLEAVRIARAGYTSRFRFDEFTNRFFCLSTKSVKGKKGCQTLLDIAKLKNLTDYQVGHTRVFLRADAFTKLEGLKRVMRNDSIIFIQKIVRGWLVRKRIREAKEAEERRLREEAEAKARAENAFVAPPVVEPVVVNTIVAPVPPPRKEKPKKRKPKPKKAAKRTRSHEFVEEPVPMERGGGGGDADDLMQALAPLIALAKKNLEPILGETDIEEKVLVTVAPAVILLIIAIINPQLFITILVLALLGFGAALQFRQYNLSKQNKKKKKGKKNNRKQGAGRLRGIQYSTGIHLTKLRDDGSVMSDGTSITRGTRGTRLSKRSKGGIKASQKKQATLRSKDGLNRPGSRRSMKLKQGNQKTLPRTGSSRSLRRTQSGRFTPVK